MEKDVNKWSKKKLKTFITNWQQQGRVISNTFFDENDQPIEVRKFQPNILPENIIEAAKKKKILPQDNQ